MKETFLISGMTCSSCETAVQQKILSIPSVTSAEVSRENGSASIVSDSPVFINQLQQALGGVSSKYQANSPHLHHLGEEFESKNWIQIYWPVILIFSFITGITLFIELNSAVFNIWQWMNHFMAGFFLVFSFFKFLNLEGFVESYATYDIIAKKWRSWGYLYATFELVNEDR